MQLFRNDGVDRIGPQASCGKVLKQNGVIGLNRARDDRVTEADIDLRFAACLGEFAGNHDPRTRSAGILADVFSNDAERHCSNALRAFDSTMHEGPWLMP